MLSGAAMIKSDISTWDVSNAIENAASFNHNLSNWNALNLIKIV